MKPLFILVKHDGKPAVAVNSQDIKLISIKRGETNKIAVTTSHDVASISMSDYAVDKLRKEIRDRYNVVKLTQSGFSRNSDRHKNDVLEVYQNNDITIIFPKALKKVTANGMSVNVDVFGGSTLTVGLQPADIAVNNEALNLTPFSAEEV